MKCGQAAKSRGHRRQRLPKTCCGSRYRASSFSNALKRASMCDWTSPPRAAVWVITRPIPTLVCVLTAATPASTHKKGRSSMALVSAVLAAAPASTATLTAWAICGMAWATAAAELSPAVDTVLPICERKGESRGC